MGLQNRQVVVDDDNSLIDYSSLSWKLENGTRANIGDYGPPFSGTLHSTNASTYFITKFTGSSISIYGSIDVQFTNGVQDPQWECTLGGDLSLEKPPESTIQRVSKANNFKLCSGDGLSAGSHELVVTVTTNRSSFAFDYLLYTPLPDADLSNKVIRIESSDDAIEPLYGTSIQYTSESATLLVANGSSLSVTFVGNSLAWYGCTPTESPWTAQEPSSAVYSIDGQANHTFTMESSTRNLTSQLLFTTPDLSSGKHKLIATYLGNARQQVPLCLDYLIVTRNGTAGVDSSSPSSIGAQKSPTTNPKVIGAIVGGVVGGFIVTFLVVLCALQLYRRLHRPKVDLDLLSEVEDNDLPSPQITPFFSTKGNRSDVTSTPLRSLTSHSGSSRSGPQVTSASSSQNVDESATRPRRLLHHRDSGIRIPVPMNEELIEVPPTYTPS